DPDTYPVASPWMSALISDAAARMYLVSENPTISDLLIGLGQFECSLGSYWTSDAPLEDETSQPVYMPFYLATRDGKGYQPELSPENDMEHAPDGGAVAAWGAYFAGLNGDTSTQSSLKTCANNLYTTWSYVINYWTRPDNPASNSDAYKIN